MIWLVGGWGRHHELLALLELPLFAGAVAVGVAVGRRQTRHLDLMMAGAFGAAIVAFAAPAVERSRQGPRVPPAVEATLPTDGGLVNLCGGQEQPADRARAEALLREIERRPQETVEYTRYWAHRGPETEVITVRALGEEVLRDLEGFSTGRCEPALQDRLRSALD